MGRRGLESPQMVYNRIMTYGIIYYWHCAQTNMGYVGQTIDTLSGRWKGHVRSAFHPRSKTGHWEFPKAIRENGKDSFVGRILCECQTPEELSSMEDHWMHELNTLWPNGYNMRDGTNFICEQTRRLISERTKLGMSKADPSWKDRQREAMNDLGVRKIISERTAAAMQRPEVKAKLDAFTDDPEFRRRMSEKLKGHVVSSETRQKIAQTLRARPKKQKPIARCCYCQALFTMKKNTQRFCSHACYRGR